MELRFLTRENCWWSPKVLLLIVLINKGKNVYKQNIKITINSMNLNLSFIALKLSLSFHTACQTSKWLLKMYSRPMSVCIKVPSENIYYMHWKKKWFTY